MEDEADVFGVHSGGEVVEERFPPVSPFTTERLHQERLETEGDKLGYSGISAPTSRFVLNDTRMWSTGTNPHFNQIKNVNQQPVHEGVLFCFFIIK